MNPGSPTRKSPTSDSWATSGPAPFTPPPVKMVGHPFKAELDVSEVDDRMRPGPTWTARSQSLSRSGMALLSRRMCYTGRQVMLAVHLIDAEPTPLFGRVIECEYHGEGLYRLVVDFMPIPSLDPIREWFQQVSGKKH